MILPKALESEFWQEFKQFEQEQRMSYVTTGERIGYERGERIGYERGQQDLILRLLQKRVGELPQSVSDVYDGLRLRIQSLSLNQLETLGEALLDFTGLDDLLTWLAANSVE